MICLAVRRLFAGVRRSECSQRSEGANAPFDREEAASLSREHWRAVRLEVNGSGVEVYVKESAVYADFEIISETTKEECAVGCVWVDTIARHAVSGETVYACVEPFATEGETLTTERIALDLAQEHARASLRRWLTKR